MKAIRALGACASVAAALSSFDALSAQLPGTVLREQEIASGVGDLTGPLQAGDRFGASVTALGDVDGDGVGDVAVGAPNARSGGTNRGALWIVGLTSDGKVRHEQRIGPGVGGFLGTLDNGDNFGSSVTTIEDLDGDRRAEIVVGASGDDDGGFDRGALWVLFLGSDGQVRQQRKISQLTGGGPLLRDGDRFGRSVAPLGDLDGDGVGELAVGAAGDDDGGSNRGAVWILFLARDGSAHASAKISTLAGNFGGALRNDDNFGAALASLGDLDGDGVGDLAVGADQDDDAANSGGAVWVLFLRLDGSVRSQSKIGGATGIPLRAFDRFGEALSSPGDVDGDGIVELVVGASFDDDGSVNRGAIWILFLQRSGTQRAWRKISSTQGSLNGPLVSNDLFGASLAGLGDLDGDGKLELAVGAPGDDSGGSDCGALRVLFLESAPTVVVRNGTGINRVRLAARSAPRVGEKWEVLVDCRDKRAGLVLHVIVDRPLPGTLLPAGELLIDLSRPALARAFAHHRETVARIWHQLPPDPALFGLQIHSQAMVTGRGGLELTNALAARVGR